MSLHQLPTELIDRILELLDRPALRELNCASSWAYNATLPFLWHSIDLVDSMNPNQMLQEEHIFIDHHDDTRIIQQLTTLVKKPHVAACVRRVTHRCHFSPPTSWTDVTRNCFMEPTLSSDPRTCALVQLAVRNMINVTCLRIIHGHAHLTEALVRCFFDCQRQAARKVTKLWLECCYIGSCFSTPLPDHDADLPLVLDFGSLVALRLRRLPIPLPVPPFGLQSFDVRARTGIPMMKAQNWELIMRTSADSVVRQHVQIEGTVTAEAVEGMASNLIRRLPSEHDAVGEIAQVGSMPHSLIALQLNDVMYEKLPESAALVPQPSFETKVKHMTRFWKPGRQLDQSIEWVDTLTRAPETTDHLLDALKMAQVQLTSLTFDCTSFVYHLDLVNSEDRHKWSAAHTAWYRRLFQLRLPKLQALQIRHDADDEVVLPERLTLLYDSAYPLQADSGDRVDPWAGLRFLTAHEKLVCISWPMSRWMPATGLDNVEIMVGGRNRFTYDLIKEVAQKLVDLRLDESFAAIGVDTLRAQRRLIEHFLPYATQLKQIKVEGGVEYVERREVLQALQHCRLERIALIGSSSSIGDTQDLEGRNSPVLELPAPASAYEPCWDRQHLYTTTEILAGLFGESLKELKLCSMDTVVDLCEPNEVARQLLAPLKKLTRLRSLIISPLRVDTTFEGRAREVDIAEHWMYSRSSKSTAVAITSGDDANPWLERLRTVFDPKHIADAVVRMVGPYIAESAKRRLGGFHVRACFHLGGRLDERVFGTRCELFDLDLDIGKAGDEDICLGFDGPRHETDETRRQPKLDGRRWF